MSFVIITNDVIIIILLLFSACHWNLVIDDLFLNSKPSNLYNFKKKVLSAMKLRYLKVTDHGMHSGDAVSGNEDVSVVDCMVMIFFQEMQLVLDKEEAAYHEAAMWLAQKKAVSNILVPPPPPLDLPSDPYIQTQQYTTV